MQTTNTTSGFRDVCAYQPNELVRAHGSAGIPVTYQKSWDDGYGARGWKPDIAIGNPAIIASTRECGDVIPTSVLVHDLLDHIISGFEMGGHRAEAMASRQLQLRTGSDVHKDYRQLVEEDLRFGRVNGEALASFLPEDLVALAPLQLRTDDKRLIGFLRNTVGSTKLATRLTRRMHELGRAGEQHARDSWAALGLDKNRARQIGLQLQTLLDGLDRKVENSGICSLKVVFTIDNQHCSIQVVNPAMGHSRSWPARVA